MTITLWGRPSSARTQKVLLALAELGLDFDLVLASATMGAAGHVAKGNQAFGVVDTPAYRAMNPNGTVPTIDDGGYVLWESNAIVQYLAMTYDPAGFYGGDARVFASASRWMMWENNELIPPMHTYVKHTIRLPEEQRDPASVDAAREALIAAWRIVDHQLSRTTHIAADAWTMGDIPMTIRVHRWALLQADTPDFPNIARYYDRVRARPSFAAIADPQMHLAG
ncbi:MAG: glutathione S-transferase family protein [Alphaproteobacteria bacterium]|nr:glutathione S-transferase family protein [Alphaproteobacteria bacterium]